MKCQTCGKADATVHWTEISDDHKKTERHLCEECARAQEVPIQKAVSLTGVLQQLLQQKMSQELGKNLKTACPSCGLSYIEFRSSGRFGCPNDYDVFREGILPMLERLQDSVRHCGKVPSRAGRSLQLQNELIRLRREQERAVQREDYEKAAELRDRIQRMSQEEGDGH